MFRNHPLRFPASAPAEQDFELRWAPQPGHAPQAALFTQQLGSETYGALMLLPPAQAPRSSALARELIYVVDTSGSMAGTSMQQARQALLLGLDRLRPKDRFNIIQFNSGTEQMAPQNLARARHYVRSLQANGGTEMAGALRAVLPGETQHQGLRQVIFITDGSVGNEAQWFEIIQRRLGHSRLYTVGIGSAPNQYFMAEAASMGRGTYTNIARVEEVQQKMDGLLQKLAFPVLSDICLLWDGGSDVEYWPNPIQDLYLHEPLLVSFKTAGPRQVLRIEGRLHQQDWSVQLPVTGAAAERGLDILWAGRQIRSLEQQRSHGVAAEEIQAAITRLGMKHHLVTRYTSLVAVDVSPLRAVSSTARDAAIANHKPKGWSMQSPVGRMPKTATDAYLHSC